MFVFKSLLIGLQTLLMGGLHWPTGRVKVLGIYFGYNEAEYSRLNSDLKVDKLEVKLLAWKEGD